MKLLAPLPTEQEPDFITRFMNDAAMSDTCPDDLDRETLAKLAWGRRENGVDVQGWPRRYQCKFIEPGLVRYADHGTVLVTKEVLDAMMPSFEGKPVIDEMHRDASPADFRNGGAAGMITRAPWYNEQDGWYWAEFMVWDRVAQLHCENGAYSVSCAYDVTKYRPANGKHNNVPFDQEVLDGEFNHMAIVANPRYEKARIVICNSTEGDPMKWKLFFWQKDKKELRNAIEPAVAEKAVIDVDGQKVPLSQLINTFKDEEAAAAAAATQTQLENEFKDEDEVEIDGVATPLKNVKDAYRNAQKKKLDNEAAERDKDHDDGKHGEKAMENCMKCTNAAAEATRLKNEAEEADRKTKEAAAAASGARHFNELDKAAQLRTMPQPVQILSRQDKIAAGKQKYGTPDKK